MDIQLGNLSNLNLLWVVAVAVAVMIVAFVARRRALARFATANLVGRLAAAGSSARQFVKAALVTAAMIALVLALLDIRWGKVWREVPQKGIEVMFVLDVSRSMLAQDATPNRLQRAKQQIGDMLDAMAGDRVGLVAFAGDARQLVPLTSHYHDFKQTLSEVGPQDVDRGGSRLGDALKLAADGFLDHTGDHKAIVVFTDGEDQESGPVKTAEQLHRDQGIRVFTVGLGDMDHGARIPVQQSGRGRSYLEYKGQQVWSKMNGAVLKQAALVSGGAYIPAGTKQVDMAQVYHNYVAQVEQQDFETARINSYVPRYQWFVGLGLLLLVLDTLLPTTRRQHHASGSSAGWAFLPKNRSRTRQGLKKAGVAVNQSLATSATTDFETDSGKNTSHKHVQPASKVTAAACLAMLLLLPQASFAAEPGSLVRQANQALRAGKIDQALADYQQAAQSDPDRPELLYNQAVAHYRNGQYGQARQFFTQAASSADDQLDAKVRYNLANCDYAEAVQLAGKDKPAAIERLRSAISHYRATLTANSADTDARANAQLAQMLIDRLQQEEEKQKQQQQKQQDKQQQDKQDSSSDQDKQDQQNKDQQNEKQDQQNKDQQNGDSKDQSPVKKDQQQADKNESGQQDQQEQPQDQQPQPAESQEKPQPQDQDGRPQPTQPDAAQPQDSQQPPEAGQATGTPQFGHDDSSSAADARPMTKEEAQKMLQAVRDRELMRRLEQQQQSQRHRAPVDRDW